MNIACRSEIYDRLCSQYRVVLKKISKKIYVLLAVYYEFKVQKL